jgi:hypothetical protein
MSDTPASPARLRFAVWLLPAEPFRSLMRTSIARMADEFGGPVFEPHLTVYAGETDRPELLDGLLGRIGAEAVPCSLVPSGVGHGPEFFRCVYLQFRPDPGLEASSDRIRNAVPGTERYDLFPHLSLLYGSLDEPTRRRAVEMAEMPAGAVYCNELSLVVPRNDRFDWHDVGSWSVEERREFE